MEKRRMTTFAFQEEEEEVKDADNRIVHSKNCCLTCGGNKRIQWTEKVDGKKVIKEACIYCLTKNHTHSNEVDH